MKWKKEEDRDRQRKTKRKGEKEQSGREGKGARTTGEAVPRDRNNFPHKYTRVSLIITGKRPA